MIYLLLNLKISLFSWLPKHHSVSEFSSWSNLTSSKCQVPEMFLSFYKYVAQKPSEVIKASWQVVIWFPTHFPNFTPS